MHDHEMIRKQFPICEKQVYLDSGFGNGGCKIAQEAMEQFFQEQFSGEAKGKTKWNEAADEVRQLSAELLGVEDAKYIAITKNTVEGINIVAQSFPWKAGDKVIINDQEHTSNLMPWLALKEKGVVCEIVKAEQCQLPVEAIAAAMDEHTRMVAISHVQNASGYRSDLQRLAEICHQRGIYLVVDAIQSLGSIPFDAKGWGVDAVAAGGHKGLLAVPGVGILYVAPQLLSQLKPLYEGASAVNSIDREQWLNLCHDDDSAVKLELSNLNYLGLYALRAGIKYLLELGVENIWQHISALSAKLNAALRAMGYHVVSAHDDAHRSSVVSVSVPDPMHMKTWFGEQGITISKMDAGYVRFSLGVFNNESDIEKALAAAKQYKETFIQ